MIYQEKIKEIANYITQNLIAEIPRNIYEPQKGIKEALTNNGEIKNKEKFVPITTTLLLLNSCMGNNTLIEGGSGTGKTRLASVVGSLLFQIPYELFERRRIVGTPGVTVNEIYATHDLGELSQGKDVAFLYLPFYAPFLIIDELNRFSELEQNRIREGVAANVWNYANHSWIIKNQLVVSAINPESYGGTFILNENLLDNYSIVLEPAYYNSLFHNEQVKGAEERIKQDLGLEEAVNKLMEFYALHKNDSKLIKEKLEKVQEQTIKEFKEKNIPLIENGFIYEIKKEIEKIKFSPEGELFFHSVLAEVTYNRKYGRLRFDDPITDDSHDKNYLQTKIKEGLAGRFLKDWTDLSKGIAWYFGKKEVDVDEIKAAFIYTSPRRIKPQEDFYQEVLNNPRMLPINFEMARKLIETAWKNYSDFAEPQNQAFNLIRKAIRIMNKEEKGTFEEGIKILQKTDHPLAQSVLEAVALQKYYQDKNDI